MYLNPLTAVVTTDRRVYIGELRASMTDDERAAFCFNAVMYVLDVVRRHHDPGQLRIACPVLTENRSSMQTGLSYSNVDSLVLYCCIREGDVSSRLCDLRDNVWTLDDPTVSHWT